MDRDTTRSPHSPPVDENEFLISPISPEPTRDFPSRPHIGRTPTNWSAVSEATTRRGSSPASLRPNLRRKSTYQFNIPGKEVHDQTEKLRRQRSGQNAQWGIHWHTPLCMALLFLAGVIAALGHHSFYASLDGKPAKNQLAMVRYGTGLAFIIKATLVGSVAVAYKQRIWVTMRNKPLSLAAIDGLFSANEDPLFFRNMEMLWKAKLASLLAAATWLMPIAAILAPASLTAAMAKVDERTTCQVPTLNFTAESVYNFRTSTLFPGYSLNFYNTTLPSPGGYDWYDQPSKQARRLTTMAVLHHGYILPNSPCGNQNCTYVIEFQGPAYDCQEIAPGSDAAISAPFNHSLIAPEGPLIYNSEVDEGDYLDPNMPLSSEIDVLTNDPTIGIFASEPILWIGYSVNTSNPLPVNSPYAGIWNTEMESHLFRCEHKHAIYQTEFTYTSQTSDTNITIANLTFGQPLSPNSVIESNLTRDSLIFPQDAEAYKLTTAYHGMGLLMRNYLRGEVELANSSSYPITRSDISETNLIDQSTSFPIPNLGQGIQEFYQTILISLLYEPHLQIAANTTVSCVRSSFENQFNYHAQALWIGYTIIIFIAAVACMVGLAALFHNGVTSDTLFSRVMVTTRNDTLDELSRGACLGGDPFPRDLKNVKVRFGVLTGDDYEVEGQDTATLVQHCAFGTVDETKMIEKGKLYR